MGSRKEIHTAILGAVIQEVEPLFPILDRARSFEFHGQQLRLGTYAGRLLLLGTTGIGKVNAAVTTSALLERYPVLQIWNVGCSGAYIEGSLQIGDVLITETSILGDEGVLAKNSILSSSEIDLPILERKGREFFDFIPSDLNRFFPSVQEKAPPGRYRLNAGAAPATAVRCNESVESQNTRTADFAPDSKGIGRSAKPGFSHLGPYQDLESFQLSYGPSLTVGMASGDAEAAYLRFQRYGALAENMEGSAIAQACFRFNVPMIECRGISNIAGDRFKENWQLRKAMEHCHGIVLRWLF
ncbi:MAG: hypothetical protein AB2L11_10150 [Syntrophobacteraceae bacterium]